MNKWLSYQGLTPEFTMPERIRLSNGMTRTDASTFTQSELEDAGYTEVSEPPAVDPDEKVIWNGNNWEVVPLTKSDYEQKWSQVRSKRDKMINDVEWRIQRHQSELRLGITPTDSIELVDRYIQDLRDITTQDNPFEIQWPDLMLDDEPDSI